MILFCEKSLLAIFEQNLRKPRAKSQQTHTKKIKNKKRNFAKKKKCLHKKKQKESA